MFQGVRRGSVLYVLKKGETPTLATAQVVSVSNPYSPPSPQNIFAQNPVVDIQVNMDGSSTTFKELPAMSAFVASPDGTIVSDNPESMMTEVKNLYRTSQQIVESAPHHEKLLPVYESFYDILDPSLAKEKEKDKRLSYLEDKVSGMEGTLTDIHRLLLSNWNSSKET